MISIILIILLAICLVSYVFLDDECVVRAKRNLKELEALQVRIETLKPFVGTKKTFSTSGNATFKFNK